MVTVTFELPDGSWKVLNYNNGKENEGEVASGKYCFVKKKYEAFIRVIKEEQGIHIKLAECADEIDYAGEASFAINGQLRWFNNKSNAFEPDPKLHDQVAFFPANKFYDWEKNPDNNTCDQQSVEKEKTTITTKHV